MRYHPIGKLPPDAEAELKAAAQLADPRERQSAIDKAQARAKARYPNLFRKETMTKVRIENVRIGFAHLFEPTSFPGSDDLYYQCRPIIPPKHPAVKLIDAAMLEAANEKWGDKGKTILDKLIKDGKVAFLKEDYCDKNGEPRDGYAGVYSIACSNKTRPTVVDRDRTPLTAQDGRPYSGCFSTVIIDIWAQDNSFGRRLNASLMGVQFVKDGDAFSGGRPASADDFDDLAEGVDDEENELA